MTTANAFVYFIGCLREHILKIGWSASPKARLQTLRRGSPHELKLLATFEFDNPEQAKEFEEMLHERLAAYKIRGEWFGVHGRMKELVYAATVRPGNRDSFMEALSRCRRPQEECD